jgi:hypothetical protein
MHKPVARLLSSPFYGFTGTDTKVWSEAILKLLGMINSKESYYAADSMIIWKRSLLFLQDKKLRASREKFARTPNEYLGFTWRYITLIWAAKQCLGSVEGDFVECGVYEGTSMAVVTEYVDFGSTGRHLYLYDCFDHVQGDTHMKLKKHGSDLLKTVQERFAHQSWAHIVKGYVPDSFSQSLPEKIAFAHIDMNDAKAEVGALEALWPRLQPGAIVVLDDYGSSGLEKQRLAHDEFFARFDVPVLESPTSQGIVIVPANKG